METRKKGILEVHIFLKREQLTQREIKIEGIFNSLFLKSTFPSRTASLFEWDAKPTSVEVNTTKFKGTKAQLYIILKC